MSRQKLSTYCIMETIYYYSSENSEFEQTNSLDELIKLLYNGDAKYIPDKLLKKYNLSEDYNQYLKKIISTYDLRIPLYDIETNNIYLVFKENVYPRIYRDNYRMLSQDFLEDVSKLKHNMSEKDKNNVRIMKLYDMKRLKKTYMTIFYESFVINEFITSCKRPSYSSGLEHITPYYTIKELYYLARDWNLTASKNITDEHEIKKLCKSISQYDIPAETLMDHQEYIYDSKMIGLVKHYSLFGSFYMNKYLRGHNCHPNKNFVSKNTSGFRNILVEKHIEIMSDLMLNAPKFKNDHTVYRFIESDRFLSKIKIGDVYTDNSFMSTTRNPFYVQENYMFGYILMKIKLPKNIKGIGLCIESYSNFSNEEEIILPPFTKLRLDRVVDEGETDPHYTILNKKVIKKYEFTWIGSEFLEKKFELFVDGTIADIPLIDFRNLIDNYNIQLTTISDRLHHFIKNYCNINNQFKTKIGGIEYIFMIDSYDSSSVYKKFFYYEVRDGLIMYSYHPKYGNINIMIELGTTLHVNYYFKYAVTDTNQLLALNRKEWIEWFSYLSFVIGARDVVVHPSYSLSYSMKDPKKITFKEKQMSTRYTFLKDVYEYLKNGTRFYDDNDGALIPEFDYYQLDYLGDINPSKYININDKGELYSILIESNVRTMKDFYIYLVEYQPKHLNKLNEIIDKIYLDRDNPFNNINYRLEPWRFLYNNSIINYTPSEKEFLVKGSFKKLIGAKKIVQFNNRLREYIKTL